MVQFIKILHSSREGEHKKAFMVVTKILPLKKDIDKYTHTKKTLLYFGQNIILYSNSLLEIFHYLILPTADKRVINCAHTLI